MTTWIQDPIPGMEGYAEPRVRLQCPPTGGEGLREILGIGEPFRTPSSVENIIRIVTADTL